MLLAHKADLGLTDRVFKTAAAFAAGSGHTDGLLALLSAGVGGNADYQHRLIALMWAAHYGHADTAKILLARGADFALRDDRGESPWSIAEGSGNREMVDALRSAGAKE